MARGLDHIVHAVRDLDAAAELYRRLGFTVGARNRHPPAWGTHNHIVQFPGCFVELLAIADPAGIAPHGARSFSFGAHNRDFLSHQEGLSMLVLEGRGAEDAAGFRAAGIGDFELFDFEREAKRPDGTTVKVAFSLAFADPHGMDAAFFTSQQHFPENFWNAAFQVHANTASGIHGVILVAENPTDQGGFLSAFVAASELQATSSGITVQTPRGVVDVMAPATFRNRFGAEPPDVSGGARLAALRFAVRDIGAAVSGLKTGGIDGQMRMGRIVVGPDAAMGVTLVFEPA
jgi:hypothetical protein